MFKIIAAIAALFITVNANAAEYTYGRTLTGAKTLTITGEIFDTDEYLIEGHLAIEPKYVYLDSPGGSVQAGWAMAEAIRNAGAETVVNSSSKCASACTFAFMGGVERWVEDGAKMGYHPASVEDWQGYTQDQAYGYGQATAIDTALRYAYYAPEGAEFAVLKFINKVYQTTTADEMHWADHDELVKVGFATSKF